jgi:hypothetical protein
MPIASPSAERFASYTFVEDWPELIVAINELETRLRLNKKPVAADRLLDAYSAMRTSLLAMAREMAVFATETLKEMEKRTQVRPDTHGGGGARLEDNLLAEAIDQDVMPGAIGIADEDLLAARVPWWVTNEEGSSARVGGTLFGYFHGAGDESPPDSTQFREHPLFSPATQDSNDPNVGLGIITHAIPERRFVKKALPIIDAEWQSRFRLIKATFDRELQRVGEMDR